MAFASVTNLAFAGAGVRGCSYVGALRAAERQGLVLTRVTKAVGTSVGALAAALVCLGYTVDEMQETMIGTSVQGLFDVSMRNIVQRRGIADGNELQRLAETLVAAKQGGNGRALFSTLSRELEICSTCLSPRRAVYFTKRSHPHMAIADAIRRSMSIPFVFQPVEDERGRLWVDGGVTDNFPVQRIYNNKCPSRTLAFRMQPPGPRDQSYPESVVSYGMEMITNLRTRRVPRSRVVCIRSDIIGTINFSLTNEDRLQLLRAGEEATEITASAIKKYQSCMANETDQSDNAPTDYAQNAGHRAHTCVSPCHGGRDDKGGKHGLGVFPGA